MYSLPLPLGVIRSFSSNNSCILIWPFSQKLDSWVCWFSSKLFAHTHKHNLPVLCLLFFLLSYPQGTSSILAPGALVSAQQHFPSAPCHNRWVLIFTYAGVMTFSVYFIHGPRRSPLQLCSLSARNPINLSAISALCFFYFLGGGLCCLIMVLCSGYSGPLLLINWRP